MPDKDAPKERRNFTIDPAVLQLLEKLAARHRRSRSAMVEELIRLAASKEKIT